MRITESTEWKKHLKECRRMLNRGLTIEDILAQLRKRGTTKVESIVLLTKVAGITNEDAKVIVHQSMAWGDVRSTDDRLHVAVDATVKKLGKLQNQRKR